VKSITSEINIHQKALVNIISSLPVKAVGMTKNVGPENGGSRVIKGRQIQSWKMRDQMSMLENAGPENVCPAFPVPPTVVVLYCTHKYLNYKSLL